MESIRKFDAGIARGEGAIAAAVLLAMIFLASVQALLRNLTYLELSFANDALSHLAWIDEFLKKGTLWLAFLGASLATRDERHIAIDVLPKLLNDQGKRFVRGLVGFAAAAISFMLARAFWGAVVVNGLERPVSYEVLADGEAMHICDATVAQLAQSNMSAPGIFCALRGGLAGIGVPVETPGAAAQLIVPVAFVIMTVRFFATGVLGFMEMANPPKKAEAPAPIEVSASGSSESEASESEASTSEPEETSDAGDDETSSKAEA